MKLVLGTMTFGESVLGTMEELHDQGKYRELGLSNFPVWMFSDILHICDKHGWVKPTVFEGVLQPFDTGAEAELNDCLNHFELRFYAYNPMCGVNFPKLNAENGYEYYAYLKNLNVRFGEVIYGMPIIEDLEVAYKETHISELMVIKKILDKYHDPVLQVRVGGTDSSSFFGVRLGVDYSLSDIMTVRECLRDIINVCGRNNDYVISGSVWEFSAHRRN